MTWKEISIMVHLSVDRWPRGTAWWSASLTLLQRSSAVTKCRYRVEEDRYIVSKNAPCVVVQETTSLKVFVDTYSGSGNIHIGKAAQYQSKVGPSTDYRWISIAEYCNSD